MVYLGDSLFHFSNSIFKLIKLLLHHFSLPPSSPSNPSYDLGSNSDPLSNSWLIDTHGRVRERDMCMHNKCQQLSPFSVPSMYTFLGMNSWYSITIYVAPLWERLLLSHSLYFLSRSGTPMRFSSHTLACLLVFLRFRTCSESQLVEISWIYLPFHCHS